MHFGYWWSDTVRHISRCSLGFWKRQWKALGQVFWRWQGIQGQCNYLYGCASFKDRVCHSWFLERLTHFDWFDWNTKVKKSSQRPSQECFYCIGKVLWLHQRTWKYPCITVNDCRDGEVRCSNWTNLKNYAKLRSGRQTVLDDCFDRRLRKSYCHYNLEFSIWALHCR